MPATQQRAPHVETVPWRFVTTNRHALKQKVLDALERGAKGIILDLSATSYIDSAGLGVLYKLHFDATKVGARLILVGANEDIQELLVMTKLAGVLVQSPSIAEARALLEAPAT